MRNLAIGLMGALLLLGLPAGAHADAGDSDLVVLAEGGFSGGSNPANNGFYTTGVNTYALSGNLGYWFSDNWEGGLGAGLGRVDYQNCSAGNACSGASRATDNFNAFLRYNFAASYGGEYSFTGLGLTYVRAGGVLGNVSVLRPFGGYRLPLVNGWAIELSVGAGVPVAGNTSGFSTNYDIQLGVAIPL